jgi:hypothetical protein
MNTNGPTQEDNIADFPGRESHSAKEDHQPEAQNEPNLAELEHRRLLYRLDSEAEEARESQRKKSFMNRLLIASAFGFVVIVFNFVSYRNPEIYDIDPGTLKIINQAINALILLTVPFVLGIIGAAARILISDIKPEHKTTLIVSSGLMAVFSWVSIKSGVLVALLAPHLEKANLPQDTVTSSQSDFYTMALVAIAVGMFSTNVYLMIAQRVDQLTARSRPDSN